MENNPSIIAAAECIVTKQDFLDFLADLSTNSETVPDDWENTNIRAYLEGLRGFATDTADAVHKNDQGYETVSWRRVAELLLAARVYD